MSTSDVCVGCQKPSKRLATHLAQNAWCASPYSTHDNSVTTTTNVSNNSHVNTSHVVLQEGTPRRRLNLSSFSSRGVKESGRDVHKKLGVKDAHEFKDDFVVDNDDASNYDRVDDQDVLESEEEKCQADHSVFDLYEKLFKLATVQPAWSRTFFSGRESPN